MKVGGADRPPPLRQAVGILANLDKADAGEVARRVAAWLEERGVKVMLTPELAKAIDRPDPVLHLPEQADLVDFLIVLGGDGSLLGAARRVAPSELPLLGVNLGRLGFLTEVELPDLFEVLPCFLRGEYVVDRRAMLAVELLRAGGYAWRRLALNEATLSKGPFARPVDIQVRAGGQLVATYAGDGVIVATPTGSTAYALSAGGPILHPEMQALLITPICPHTLYARTVVVPADERIRVRVAGEPCGTVLTVDGQEGISLEVEDEVVINLAAERTTLLRRPGWSFYRVLGAKLPEGGLRDGG